MTAITSDLTEAEKKENIRLASLYALNVLDSEPEETFNGLVDVAASCTGAPISLLALIDRDRLWFKANSGMPGANQTPRDKAFCSHVIDSPDELVEIPDASADSRTNQSPMVTGQPGIRFYAGAKLRLGNGTTVGTLCVIDNKPGALTETQRKAMLNLARVAVELLVARRTAAKLSVSESRFRGLCDASPLGIVSSTDKGECNYMNTQCQKMLGLEESAALGFSWKDSLHKDDRDMVADGYQKMLQQQDIFDSEFRVVHKCGSTKHIRAIAVPTFTTNGTLNGSIGVLEDTTRRILKKRSLTEERSRLESIINGTGAGTWEWNIQTDEFRINNRFREICDQPSRTFTTVQQTRDLIHPDDLKPSDAALHQHLTGKTEHYQLELRIKNKDGGWVWVFDCGQIVTYTAHGNAEWMYGTRLDINERKIQAQQLVKTREQMATDQRRTALSQERLRLARDMHDTLAHSLMALLTQIRVVRKLRRSIPEEKLVHELDSLETVAISGISEARAAITQMRHNDVKDIGLDGAIQSLCDRFTEHTGISARIRINKHESTQVQEHAESLFRIVEEALHNIERHSRANKVSILLSCLSASPGTESKHKFRLSVADNGVGFLPSKSKPGHYGIRGMKEQATLMDGKFSVLSKPARGTTVSIEFSA